ncbi:nitrogenase stabilizing/protective protein [Bradyrhizobium centrolobii]|uniref:Nitrogenase-stabilizing/protective protein NifW n=2 Tax=Bradyrhizobium TaxID=374 RepID=A0A176ZF98_9BRAD|nr:MULTISPECIES: nitrogenase stabilizing/protective protein NifW [Bradyrhizobium]OAF06901.1 nitrogenase stabilizing/protective protein [Bradyrhizobium centrolobii]OAF19219.1 nitrogenase stabilizing/protective protein [Bradyrhizobium neotropicale]
MVDGILARLDKAAAAEEIFAILEVDYDPKVVNVARLHILRRMGQYLEAEDFTGAPDEAVAKRCKEVLERAYADFVTSSPIDQRVFKVLKDAVSRRPKEAQALVQLDALK